MKREQIGQTMVVRLRRGLVALTLVSLVVVGCGGDGEDAGAGESEQSAEQVTLEEYHQIKKGWSEDEVRDLVGDPKRTETTNVQGLGRTDCWYYGGDLPEPTTQICFENGQVAFKTQYVKK
jgi:hypothetical protein